MAAEAEHDEQPRRSRAWFGWGLGVVFVLLVGGCVAALVSVNDPRSGLAGDGDYRLTISSCEVVDGIPMGSGTIRSTNPELESFRVQMWAYDNETGEIVGRNSRIVPANTDRAEPFDGPLIDVSDLTPSVQPGSVSCAARVFLNS